jgi:hypothetical protein
LPHLPLLDDQPGLSRRPLGIKLSIYTQIRLIEAAISKKEAVILSAAQDLLGSLRCSSTTDLFGPDHGNPLSPLTAQKILRCAQDDRFFALTVCLL